MITLKTKIIIQARINSTRLYQKIILPFFKGETILDIIIKRLILNFPKEDIFLATSTNPKDLLLKDIAKKYSINFFQGDEDNVLNRFINLADNFNIDNIIRICADNPFLDINLIKNYIELSKKDNYDYISHFVSKKQAVITTHFGFWSEFVSVKALKKVKLLTSDKLFLEHVTNYIYTNEYKFNILKIEAPNYVNKYLDFRLTVDTKNDFNLAQKIYTYLDEEKLDITPENIFKIPSGQSMTYKEFNSLLKDLEKKSILINYKGRYNE